MKIYWHRGNIPGFVVGITMFYECMHIYITGRSGGIWFRSSGLEAYIRASGWLVIAGYFVSRIFWDKKDRDFKLIEGVGIVTYLILCELVPHFFFTN
jgi:hypothetical protein